MKTERPTFYSDRFSIKDLELFSGIKAHTIRAWERRFGLLAPKRSDTNIRSYSIGDLKTLLNTTLLLKGGLSISEVAAMTPKQREENILTSADRLVLGQSEALNTLKMATLAYDEALFEQTSRNYRVDHGFEALIEHLYLPLLQLLGLFWQSSAICPAQEHFASSLVRQKLIGALDALPLGNDMERPIALLFLPENEIHDLGLLYLHYRLRRVNMRTIYLGESVPLADLGQLAASLGEPTVACCLCTVQPQPGTERDFLERLFKVLPSKQARIHCCGAALLELAGQDIPAAVRVHADIGSMIAAVLAEKR
jgi:DNA-binding transcriptional MerR regulator